VLREKAKNSRTVASLISLYFEEICLVVFITTIGLFERLGDSSEIAARLAEVSN
jgi:hypothetical protein